MSNPVACPECGHTGDEHEFQGHNEDLAPDLFDTHQCPQCEHFWSDDE